MNSSPVKAIVLISKSMLFRLSLIIAVVLAGPAALTGYIFYTSRPTYLVKKGEEYLGRGNLDQAKQMADRLQRKGHNSAAHILRGKILLSQARAQLKNDPPPFPYEGIQRAAQTILSSVSVPAYLPVLRGPASGIVGLYRAFAGLARRGWQMVGAAIYQAEHGTPQGARFARA